VSDKSSKTFNLNFETVGSIMAIMIVMIALFVAWDQASLAVWLLL
jgi:hypothetical protein